jgi:Tfp pilus assembly protein PilF
VLLEDQDRRDEATGAYQQALQCDPDHSDSHHNLARIFEASGRVQHAIRHFNHYRRFTK